MIGALRALMFSALCWLAVLTPDMAIAERRIALVIGNGNYANIQKLPNPANDANGMASALRSLGFEVLHRTDLDRQQMIEILGNFTLQARDADVALIFYAGHAVQVAGRNFLLPVDMVPADQVFQVTLNAIPIAVTYESLADHVGTTILILDSCRNNPFNRGLRGTGQSGNGLASMSASAGRNGSYIAFSTAPDSTAEDGSGFNSPYTRALLKHIATPGIDIDAMFALVGDEVKAETFGRQIPWRNSSLSSNGFRFLPAQAGLQPQSPPIPPPNVCSPASEDVKLWEIFRQANTIEALERYLGLCPNGIFVSDARKRVEELRNGNPSLADWYLLVYPNLDFWGGDTTEKGQPADSAEKCAEACALDTACKLFSFNSEKKQCYPKNKIDLPIVYPGIISGVFIRRELNSQNPPEPRDIQTRFRASQNQKHSGPINSRWQKRAATIDQCLRACDQDGDCISATWGERQSNGSRCALRYVGILKSIFGKRHDLGSTAFDKEAGLVSPAKAPIPLPGLNLAK